MGVLGTALLIWAAVLVVTLPETVIPNPQFRLDFLESTEEMATVSADLLEGETVDFEVPVPSGANLIGFSITVGWTDDMASSAPDRFKVELLDPDGVTSETLELANPSGRPDESNGGLTSVAVPFEVGFNYVHNPKPTAAIVEGAHPDETVQDAARRIIPEYEAGGGGVWRIRVTLLEAGDCTTGGPVGPAAPACPVDPQNPRGEDAGNSFSVTRVTYSSYEPILTPLD